MSNFARVTAPMDPKPCLRSPAANLVRLCGRRRSRALPYHHWLSLCSMSSTWHWISMGPISNSSETGPCLLDAGTCQVRHENRWTIQIIEETNEVSAPKTRNIKTRWRETRIKGNSISWFILRSVAILNPTHFFPFSFILCSILVLRHALAPVQCDNVLEDFRVGWIGE